MRLRTRLALLVGITVLVASIVGGAGVALSSRNAGIARVDDQLLVEAERFRQSGAPLELLQRGFQLRRATCGLEGEDLTGPRRDREPLRETRNQRLFELAEPATALQVVRRDGTVFSACIELPVNDDDSSLASTGRGSDFRTVAIDGTEYRLLTIGFGDGGALQLAKDLALPQGTLRGLLGRIVGFGVLGALVAAALGWFLSARETSPVEELSSVADRIARTQNLNERIEIDGTTELNDLAGSFNSMLSSLETSKEQQRRLVQDAGHELRTPLTSIRTNLELLERHTDMPEDMRNQLLRDLNSELVELTDLTHELVEAASVVPGTIDQLVPIELGQVAQRCADRAARRHRRQITCERSDADDVVDGDPQLIARAINNLVNNAAKFAPTGEIRVRVDGSRLEVDDRGPGVDPQEIDQLFERFWRSADARAAPGSGLGLSIVEQVVRVHGGQVHAANRAGGGLTVGFTLPRPSAPHRAAQ